MFNLANSICSIELKQPLLTLIIRAKKNCVAYYKAEKPKEKKKGRRAKYGKKVILMQLFDRPQLFSKVLCSVYGKTEEISILTLNLLWKPTGDMIRFVLAVTSRGPIVLMCSDLNQDPVLAIQLYCIRMRIETMFDILKNLIGSFQYRFWSKQMPRHSRKPKKNKELKRPSQSALANVELCWNACERFVMFGAIAQGLLQLISIKFRERIWRRFDAYLRTRSRQLPSERTVKHVIARLLLRDFLDSATSAIMREIKNGYFAQQSGVQIQSSGIKS